VKNDGASHDRLLLRHPFVLTFVAGALLTLLGVWPMVMMVVPDRLDTVAKICTTLALPGLIVAVAIAQNVHTYSPVVVYLADFFFYSALAGFVIWLWRRRVS
jgi:hypothetical protein